GFGSTGWCSEPSADGPGSDPSWGSLEFNSSSGLTRQRDPLDMFHRASHELEQGEKPIWPGFESVLVPCGQGSASATNQHVVVPGTIPGRAIGDTAEGQILINIVLADDEHLVRGAIAALLGLEEDLEVVAEIGRGDQVVDTVL